MCFLLLLYILLPIFFVTMMSWISTIRVSVISIVLFLFIFRFGDYVSDQVVAPVRETCAQALGAAFKYMHPILIFETMNVLLKMQVNLI